MGIAAKQLALVLSMAMSSSVHAAIVEEVVQLPVRVKGVFGIESERTITLTIFRDDAREKSPFLILSHGRPGDPADRARLGRIRFEANSRYFVQLGFAVFLPTRVGYGVTGGPDLESSGRCENRNFTPGFEAAATQSLAVIEYAKVQKYVDASRGMLVGQSYGGATTLALVAKNVEGVAGGINFAGGSGGEPDRRPGNPCSPGELGRVMAGFAAPKQKPTLWLYAQNDLYWGAEHPLRWFEDYRSKGGIAEFIRLPAHGRDGHASFGSNPAEWRPHVQRFLESIGFPSPGGA